MQVVQIRSTDWTKTTRKLHWPILKRIVILNAHPTKFILKSIGAIWAIYFLWNLNWVAALTIALLSNALGTFLVWGTSEEELLASPFGKLVMTHWHPLAMSFHVLATVVLALGIISHSAPWILTGVTLYLMSHLWGWHEEF